MGVFNKLFGTKDKQKQPGRVSSLTDEEKRQEELNIKFHSIFPYFKQFLTTDDNSISESLPDDLSKVDKQKIYSIPELNIVSKNICDDLTCLYVYNNESSLEIIQESELNELNISKDELHEIAMANYRQLISQRLNVQNNGETFWFILDGNLEAGLILVDEIWDQVEGYLKEEIVICVPSRDVIIATGKSNENEIAKFTEQAKQILTSGDHPLSTNWFVRQNKEWSVYRKIIA